MEYLTRLFQYSRRLYNWSKAPWPLHIFPVFVFIHLLLQQLSPENHLKINSYCSVAFQIIGGLIVLHSINSNMRLLSKSNIIKEAYKWIKSFPPRLKNQTINVSDLVSATACASGDLVLEPNLSSIEEKVEYLLKETKRIESKVDATKKQLQQELQMANKESNKKHLKLQNEIHEIGMNLKSTIVGSVKLEILGILTISYGIFIPVIY